MLKEPLQGPKKGGKAGLFEKVNTGNILLDAFSNISDSSGRNVADCHLIIPRFFTLSAILFTTFDNESDSESRTISKN